MTLSLTTNLSQAMVKKKCDLAVTTLILPPLYPALDILCQLSDSPGAVCLNIAPQTRPSPLKQVDVFEKCVLDGNSLISLVPSNTEVLIINDLSFWVVYRGIECVYRELLELSRKYKVMSSITVGTLDPEQEETILLLSDVIISLVPSASDTFSGTCTETVRQTSGRTESSSKNYHISEGSGVYKLDLYKVQHVVASSEDKASCDVTFEMGLSEREKDARATTILPYTAAATQPVGNQATGGTDSMQTADRQEGDIHYTPEEEDDWDDEDPDDDLDI